MLPLSIHIHIHTYSYSQKNSAFPLWRVAKFGYICLLVDDQQSTYFTELGRQKKKHWAQCVWSSQIALMQTVKTEMQQT
jgi:hypothetical protein